MALHAAIAALLLMLTSACGTTRVVRLDTGQGAPLEHKPPAPSRPVRVEAGTFEEALARLVLNAPLTLRPPEQGWLVRASHPDASADDRWGRFMAKSYGGLCRAGQRKATCLSLLDDVLGLSEWDKLGVALALSLEPMKASISRAVERTLAPQLFYGLIATGLISWVVLAANPEPAFTKAAAIVSVLMLIYLGIESFFEVVAASGELKRATDRATTAEELGRAGQHFADRVGPQVARVFVLAVTLVVCQGMAGGAALLSSRVAMLPSFTEAAAMGASRVGITLASLSQVSAVAIVRGTVVISLPATAVAMSAMGSDSNGTGRGGTKLKPDPAAQGPHTTFKRDPQTGKVSGHAEWQPNSRNPSGFEQAKRVDTQYSNPHTHHDKATGEQVPTPHAHDQSAAGGVRPARPDELPQ